MSDMITSTSAPSVKARCSATVRAIRGVRIRSITGSSAAFRRSTSSPAAERSSRRSRTKAMSAWVSPIAAKTTRNAPLAACDWAAICVARARWGRPATEKIGSFCPRTRVVSASITEMPVMTGSFGGSRCTGFMGQPLTGMGVPVTGGPPSRGSPRPLHTRPSQPAPTGTCSGRPSKRTPTAPRAIPWVPSSTWSVTTSWSTSRTSPWRSSPGSSMVANSSQPTPATSPTTRSGPRSSRVSVKESRPSRRPPAFTPAPRGRPGQRRAGRRQRRRRPARSPRAPAAPARSRPARRASPGRRAR